MRSTTLVLVLFIAFALAACSTSGTKQTRGSYSNWHAMQDRGGSR